MKPTLRLQCAALAVSLPAVRQGDQVEVHVTGLSLAGTGVAELEGRRVEIPGVFAGERARVRIEHVSRHTKTAVAKLLQVVERHPARRAIPCSSHELAGGHCSGCAWMALDEGAQREQKRALLSAQLGLVVDEVVAGASPLGYRWSSKRTAFPTHRGLRLGSYTRGTHGPAFMRDCRVDHPLIVAAFAELERAAQTLRIRAYDETKHEGDLRHVWAKTNGQEVILTLITAHEESEAVERLPSELSVAGLAVSVQSERGNGMRGRSARTLSGVSELYTKLAGHDVEMGALGFLQPNPAVIERAYLDLVSHEGASPGLAFDLYAGTGITTRLLRDRFAEVIPCEGQPESARALGIEAVSVETFLAQRLEESERKPLALVIANPPRKGLGEAVCKMLLALAPEHLGIMSCGPAGLAADLATLAVDYRVTSLRAYDTLPQTPHVELVAKLVRK